MACGVSGLILLRFALAQRESIALLLGGTLPYIRVARCREKRQRLLLQVITAGTQWLHSSSDRCSLPPRAVSARSGGLSAVAF
jgi:hypothetical protein